MASEAGRQKSRISSKAASFTESVIREMTREAMKYDAVNLGQGFPDFLEAYLGWCLTVLDHVRASAGHYRYDMGIAIPRSHAAVLPAGRFGLETYPAQPDTEVRLAGPFSSLVGFSAWVFLELADQVRATAAQPPGYQGPPLLTLA